MSSSRRRSPWNADVGNAWWLLCHDSPKVASDSQATLADRSLVANRRRPKKWADRVDAEGRVVHEEDAREPGPHKRDKRAPEGSLHQPAELERECQAGQDQRLLGGVDPAHAAVLEKISRVATSVGLAH
jgi:hypothetical protein